MISKEELKAMYFYVGPYYYKNKLVRVFKTKKNLKFVFYYDDNGKLSLMGVRDTNKLAKLLTPDDHIVRDDLENAPANQEENTEKENEKEKIKKDEVAIDISELAETISDNKPERNGKVFSLESSSVEARIVPSDNPNVITLEIIDTSSEKPFPCKITFETQANNANRGKFTEDDIYTILENIEEYKELFPGENADKVLKRLDEFNIILQDSEDFIKNFPGHGTAMGVCCYQEHKIALNTDKNNKEVFKSVLKHEVFHAMSSSNYKYETRNVGISGIRRRGDFTAFNEMITEFLAGKVNGEYTGYEEFMGMFTELFGNNPPKESLRAYFENNQDKFLEGLALELNSPIEMVKEFALKLDAHLQIFNKTDTSLTKEERNKLLREYERAEKGFILQFQINKMVKNGEEITFEKFESMAVRLGLGNDPMIERFKAFVIADREIATSNTIYERINIVTQILNAQVDSGINRFNENAYVTAFNKLLPEDKQQKDLVGLFNYIVNSEGKIDTDLAHFYAFANDAEVLYGQLELLIDKFDARALVSVQQSLLIQDYENQLEMLLNIYEIDKEFYKNMIKTALIYGSDTYMGMNSLNFMGNLFDKLSEEEKIEIFTEMCNVNSENNVEKFNIMSLCKICEYYYNQMRYGKIDQVKVFPNKEVAEMMLKALITNNTVEEVYEYCGMVDLLFDGYFSRREICELTCKKLLGVKEYNKHLDEFEEYLDDPDMLDNVYGLTQEYYDDLKYQYKNNKINKEEELKKDLGKPNA